MLKNIREFVLSILWKLKGKNVEHWRIRIRWPRIRICWDCPFRAAERAYNRAKNDAIGAWKKLEAEGKKYYNDMIAAAKKLKDQLVAAATKYFNEMMAKANKLKNAAEAKFKEFTAAGLKYANSIADQAKELTNDALDQATKIGNQIANQAIDIGNDIADGVESAAAEIEGGLVDFGNAVADTATDAGNSMAGEFTSWGEQIESSFVSMGNELADFGEDLGNTLKDGIMDVIDEVGGLIDELMNAPGQMLDFILGLFRTVKNSLLSITSTKSTKKNKQASTKDYNTPKPEIMPPIPGTEKFINLLSDDNLDSKSFNCGRKFLTILLIFTVTFIYYYKSKCFILNRI